MIAWVQDRGEQFIRAAYNALDEAGLPGEASRLAPKVRELLDAVKPMLLTNYAMITLDRCDEGTAELRLRFAAEGFARDSERGVETTRALLRDLVPKLREALSAEPGFEESWSGLLLLFAKRLIDSPKPVFVSRDGVTLSLRIPMEPIFATLIELRPKIVPRGRASR
jgi:hypothetical protein